MPNQSNLRTISELLAVTTDFFAKKGIPGPRLDAELLLAEVMGYKRIELYTNFDQPLEESEVDKFRELVRRRARREPIAYIIGRREFYGRDFKVSPAVLVPQPDTETLVEAAIERLKISAAPESAADITLNIADLCTGSGAIAVTLALELPTRKKIVATDISPAALAVAEENAAALGADGRIEFIAGDLTAPLAALIAAGAPRFDAIIANPPYVRRGDIPRLSPEVRAEPPIALDGGADGLDFYRRLVADAWPLLTDGGWLAVEIGADQADEICTLARAARRPDGQPAYDGENIAIYRDLARRPRALILPVAGNA